MQPVMNKKEQRLRAGVRIFVYIVIAFPIVMIGNAFPFGGFQFISTAVLCFGFFWVMFRFVDNRSSLQIAGVIPDKTWWVECLVGILIAAVVMAIIYGIQFLSGTIQFLGYSWNAPGNSSWLNPVIIFLIQMMSVGFYEELMSRSYLLPNFKEGFSFGKLEPRKATFLAVIFSSSIFGLAHGLNPNVTIFAILNIVLAGVMLAIPFVITGRLAYSVGLHFGWNFFQGSVFGFRVSGMPIRGTIIQIQQGGEELWTGASFGPEGGLVGTFGIVLVVICTLVLIKKSGIPLQMHSHFTNSYIENEGLSKEKD